MEKYGKRLRLIIASGNICSLIHPLIINNTSLRARRCPFNPKSFDPMYESRSGI